MNMKFFYLNLPYTVILFLGIMLVLGSCQEEDSRQKYVDYARNTFQKYQMYLSENELHQMYEKSKSISDLDQRILNEIYYYNFTRSLNDDRAIEKYESIIHSDQYDSLQGITKFYVNYLLAFRYNHLLQSEKAFQYGIDANNYIKDDIYFYDVEKGIINNLISIISAREFNNKEQLIQSSIENLNQLKKEGNNLRASRFAYNIAFFNWEIQKWEETKKFAKMNLSLIPQSDENIVFIDSYSLLANAYKKNNEYDSVVYIRQKIKKLYEEKKLSEADYYKYQAYDLKNYVGEESYPKTVELYHTIENYYGPICKNRFLLSHLYSAMAEYYKDKGDLVNQKEELQKELHYVKNCGTNDEYFVQEQLRVYNSLIDIDLKLGIKKNIPKWYEEKSNIETIKQSHTNLFVSLTQYLSEQDLEYANKDLAFQESKIQNSKKVNHLYAILLFVFLLASGYIVFLYLKNQNIQGNLEKSSEKLQQKNNTISIQNNKMKNLVEALKESNENLQNFAKVAAHDIKSPLATIHSAISYIHEKYKLNIQKEDQEIFEYLNQSTMNLNNMINVLLEYSSQDKNIDKQQMVNINDTVKSALNKLQSIIKTKKAEINYTPYFPDVKANSVLVEQLFLNIIKNAIKFHKENQTPKIDISFEYWNQNQIVFKIRDEGIGIRKENVSDIFKVFKKFYTHTDQSGNGIGLAICKKIVEDFGGEIWVESQWGKGSTFYFTLPLYHLVEYMEVDES